MAQLIAGGARLLAHTSEERNESINNVTLEELEERPYPVSMGMRHLPVKYSEIVHAVSNGLERHGIQTISSELILARNEKLLIGTVEINGECATSLPNELNNKTLLCFMASENQLTAMKARVGNMITVCDNLMMSGGSVLIARKFTTRADIVNQIWHSLKNWIGAKQLYEKRVQMLNEKSVNEEQASKQILEIAAGNPRKGTVGVVPFKYAKAAWTEWTNPQGRDTKPRSEWGLLNAWTRALREAPTQSKINNVIAVSGYYGV